MVDVIRRQLYFLLDSLSRAVPDETELGSLIGYSVVGGLMTLPSATRSTQDLHFDEVKAVYGCLERSIQESIRAGGYNALCDLKIAWDERIVQILRTGRFDLPSSLLGDAISSLSIRKGSYEDKLRREGLALYQDSRLISPYRGNGEALTGDYTLIRNCFCLR
jgi:hypothetical protein